MTIAPEDRQLIEDIVARFCWLIDAGEGDAWASLWATDGKFTGVPEPLEGHEQLRAMPPGFRLMGNGKFRHLMSNIVVEEGASPAELRAKAYSLLTDWNQGGALIGAAQAHFTFVREAGDWKIKAVHADMMP